MSKSLGNDKQVFNTDNLIKEAFISLSNEKSFEDITVKDIAERTPVNRSTFYSHFEDKFDLLNAFIYDTLMTVISDTINSDTKLTEKTLQDLILIMYDYHQYIETNFKKLYKSASVLIDIRVQLKLQDIILEMLNNIKSFSTDEQEKLELVTVMLSSGIYCSTKRWYSKGSSKDPSSLLKEVLPFMTSGLKSVINDLK
ncbi:TetR/AcrR family transcriptional regulator [Clostridium sp. YIM B02505]|uniref:TetR/AcrR family transcriptional regulator n=1 Tax=Clostridium yunnanense TaxID=2800325 RepID=A0ABS1EU38_9CLOT|nr:TetR/AcrR family transcriptional regulator [Clostridium yunnanense]MBK1812808.1 TetR/AcrR family transcriptional regulator [Clostridium yunnanense]